LNPTSGLPPRPKNHGCHGHIDEMAGVPLTSHWSETGFVVSGVLATSMRSILSDRISREATSAARLGSDWLSRPAVDAEPLPQRLANPGDHEAVGLAESRQRPRLRADVADLDRAARLAARGRGSEAGGRHAGRGDADETPASDGDVVAHVILRSVFRARDGCDPDGSQGLTTAAWTADHPFAGRRPGAMLVEG